LPEFPISTLGVLASKDRYSITIGPFGSKMKADTYVDAGVPVIRGTNIGSSRSLKGDWVYIPAKLAATMPNCLLQEGDLVFPHRGAIGEVGLIDSTHAPIFLSSSMMKFRPDPDKLLSRFAYYYFRSERGRQEILRFASSVGTPGIGQPLASLRQFSIPLPAIEEQAAIADVISSLDDKIELNRRVNETLEGMAQAIFRDWFVDFGPTRRKAAGEADPVAIMGALTPDPARAVELAALFSAAFGDDGLPVGWSRRTVESIMELAYGKALPKTVRKDGPYPVYGSGGISGTHSSPLASGPGIIVGRKGTVGSLYWEAGDFFAIDTVFYVVPKDGVPLNFAWYLLQTLGLENMNTDAAVPGLNRGNAYRLEFAYGGAPLLEAFETFAGPLRARQDASNAETRTLAEARDYLLPRLMSGAVRVTAKVEAA